MTGGGGTSLPAGAQRRGISRGVYVASVVVVAVIAVSAGLYIGKTVLAGGGSSASSYLVVGTNVPYPPFEDYNSTTGNYTGFDMNFSALIAAALHRTLVIENYDSFPVLLLAVGAGTVDMAASSITESGSVGAARNGSMSFSIPYYDDNQAILTTGSSSFSCAKSNCTATDLYPLNIGVQSGTTSQAWLQQWVCGSQCGGSGSSNQTGGASTTSYADVTTELEALEAGTVQVVMIDFAIGHTLVVQNPSSYKVAGEIYTNELYGFAVQKGDPEHLLPVIDDTINQAMTNGTYEKLINEWFG